MDSEWPTLSAMSIRCLSVSVLWLVAVTSGCVGGPKHISPQDMEVIASLNSTANDESADPDARCRAVFSLFQHFIKPDITPSEIHEVLTDTRWLVQTNIVGFYALLGWIPVDCKWDKETPFVIFILPQIKPSTGRPPNLGYCIYFTLAGGDQRSEESAFTILTGRQISDSKAILREFALCYPDGTIEHVTKSGSRKYKRVW